MRHITLNFDKENGMWPSIDGEHIDGVIKTVLTSSKQGNVVEITLAAKYCNLDWEIKP